MVTRMNQMDVIANNLANINTTGFKRDELFWNELEKQIKVRQFNKFEAAAHIPATGDAIDFSQGSLKSTGSPFDVAISGDGLFSVQTPRGEAYTRDGRFTLNADDILVTQDGLPVVGEGGPIEIDLQTKTPSQVVINDQGEIMLDGVIIDKLKVVTIDDARAFRKIGGNLYGRVGPRQATPAETVSLRQGFLEDSNVEAMQEMVRMIEIFHYYQTGQKMIREQDRLLSRAVNDIGRVG